MTILAPTGNRKAFGDMIAYSEIGPALLAVSDNGYNVLVGATAAKPLLFSDYSRHPRIHNDACNSDAAGRYQFMGRYWLPYKTLLKLPDFGPQSQERWFEQLLREQHALDDVDAGRFDLAVHKVANIWASMPGAGYGQHENKLDHLRMAYVDAGGVLA